MIRHNAYGWYKVRCTFIPTAGFLTNLADFILYTGKVFCIIQIFADFKKTEQNKTR